MDCSLIAAGFSWFELSSWIGIFWMGIGLGFIIFVHELGHFLAAKSCGVKVEAFYVGFNIPFPKLFGVTIIPQHLCKFTIGETVYGIGNLPLGGYVKMLGQEDAPPRADEEPDSDVDDSDEADSKASSNEQESSSNEQEIDPRDYRAKSVLQRFWIISAGVIMNLLTAPIFAMFAFWYGVPEVPARIGSVLPGGPAYKADFRPGDQIVQLGEVEPKSALTFSDFAEYNALVGASSKSVMYIKRDSENERIRKEVQPSEDVIKLKYRTIAAVGVSPDVSTRLAKEEAVVPNSAASMASPAFENGDVITKVNGLPVKYGTQMRQLIAFESDREVKIEVARLGKGKIKNVDQADRVVLTVPPKKRKVIGIEMTFSSIVAIQENSPAAEAGIVEGEKLIELNGKPIGDPLTLSFRLREFVRSQSPVTLKLSNPDGEEKTVSLTPRMPYFPNPNYAPVSIDEFGFAIRVTNEIANVLAGSPAAEAGVMAGDKIIEAEFVAEDKKEETKIGGFPDEPFLFEDESNPDMKLAWPLVEMSLQNRLPSTKLKLKLFRKGESEPITVNLNWSESETLFADARGIRLNPDQVMVQNDSLADSFGLGMKKVKKDAGRIYTFLGSLLSGSVSVTAMGGPITIGKVAVNFAMTGPGVFLAFLAFISVNLAIVNFLPIPALDGGHAALLIWEGVTGRPPNENVMNLIQIIGLVLLLSLMLFVVSLDVLDSFF